MNLVQMLLPLYDNRGARIPQQTFQHVRAELVERFGGLTAYRSPASGLWLEEEGDTVHDEVIVYEVMTAELDTGWWRDYRSQLEQRFRQESLVVRTHKVELL
jgi:hypothetical protein